MNGGGERPEARDGVRRHAASTSPDGMLRCALFGGGEGSNPSTKLSLTACEVPTNEKTSDGIGCSGWPNGICAFEGFFFDTIQ